MVSFEVPLPQQSNAAGSVLSGFEMGRQARFNQLQMMAQEEAIRQKQLESERLMQTQALAKVAAAGNPEALAQLSAIAPDAAKGIRDYNDYKATTFTRLYGGINQLPLAQRQSALEAANQQYMATFKEEPGVLTKYTPETAGLISTRARLGRDVEKMAQQEAEAPKLEAEIGLTKAKTGTEYLQQQKLKTELSGGLVDPEKRFTMTSNLREKLADKSKTFIDTRDAYERVIASAQNPSAAGDLALIFNYMKTLDPGSTVREGEFANAQNAGGIPERIAAQYNKIIKGERLSTSQRADFVDRSTKLYDQASKSQEKLVNQYSEIAKRNKLPVEDVVLDFTTSIPKRQSSQAQQPLTAPQVGMQKNGYTYLGGDPSKPESWRKG